jgi:hypothetical protein
MNQVVEVPEAGSVEDASASSGKKKKTIITTADLDDYASTGIEVTEDVILSPLARDEALQRGIKISYRQ